MRTMNLKRRFRELVKPTAVEAMLKNMQGAESLKKAHFQYIAVHLDESIPERVPELIENVIQTFCFHEAMVGEICSSLIVGYLGIPDPAKDSSAKRAEIVSSLLSDTGSLLHIVHGHCEGWVGLLGIEGSWKYGAIVPHFSVVVKKLFELPLGVATEI